MPLSYFSNTGLYTPAATNTILFAQTAGYNGRVQEVSWGGYLTAWTIGHVNRYRAAVAGAAVSDVTLSYSLSDINHGVAAQWEYRGDPWRQPEHFDRVNPIRSAIRMKTPTLVLHGQADARVPFQSSIQLYRALADLGVEVRFWAYPREDNGFVEPAHRVHYIRAWVDWYDAH